MIYISNFFNKELRNATIRCVSIARSEPKGWSGDKAPSLAPSWKLLNDWKQGRITWIDYKIRYYEEVLSKLDVDQCAEALDGCVLLCWERGGTGPCHRYLVAQWLEAAGHIVVDLDEELIA